MIPEGGLSRLEAFVVVASLFVIIAMAAWWPVVRWWF
jgi:hypothetical protein